MSGIIPAYAGSTPCGTVILTEEWDHPRIRGEHRAVVQPKLHPLGSSPHTRGAPLWTGSTSSRPPDHPRIRGEHVPTVLAAQVFWGSSPHTRGAHPCHVKGIKWSRIIPAYAGSTGVLIISSVLFSDHPRIRGEHHLHRRFGELSGGSSPHTRGARDAGGLHGTYRRIIPAYAGSTRLELLKGQRVGDHPRIRGEHHERRREIQRRRGIIPAYAGSTGTYS